MVYTPYERSTGSQISSRRAEKKPKKSKGKWGFFLFVIAWFLLISAGITSAYYYMEQMKTEITEQLYKQITSQTERQLALVQLEYETQVNQLKSQVENNISILEIKVDSLTELLTFTRDSASNQTDQSNQLYTQLAEVKKQLDELKKNLDVLK